MILELGEYGIFYFKVFMNIFISFEQMKQI
jgi:hypothetical protein